MTTFALDTATPSPALALVRGGVAVAELRLGPTPAGGRRVLESAHHLFSAAGVRLDAVERIVVGVGPGGFTGLRIGIATALALGQGLRVPVVGASSLEALALGIAEASPQGALVAPVIDARRREVFAALYRTRAGGGLEEIVAPAARTADDFATAAAAAAGGREVRVAGDGFPPHAEILRRPPLHPLGATSPAHRISALDLIRRVETGAVRPAVPLYLRLPDAEVNRRRAEAAAAERTAA